MEKTAEYSTVIYRTAVINGLKYEIGPSVDGKDYAWLTDVADRHLRHLFIPSHVGIDGKDIDVSPDFFGLSEISSMPNLASISVGEGHGLLTVDHGNLYSKDMSILYWVSPCTDVFRMPPTVALIAPDAFRHAESLVTLEFSGALREIQSGWYDTSQKLESIIVPEGIEGIGMIAFFGCSALMSVSLPATLRTAGDRFLAQCPALETVIIRAVRPPISPLHHATADFFSEETLQKVTLYVPAESVGIYRRDPAWGKVRCILPIQCPDSQ